MTLRQKMQAQFEEEVCACFIELANSMQGASFHKIACQVAAKTGLSPEGIRKIIKRKGVVIK